MRLLHVIHSLDQRSGGPSAALRELVREQVAAGHAVTILSTDAQSAEPWAPAAEFVRRLRHEDCFAGVRLLVGNGYGRGGVLGRLRYSPEAGRHLQKVLSGEEEFPPDIVHVHGLFSHITMAAARLAAGRHVPYIHRPAGGLNPVAMRMKSAWGKRMLLLAWEGANLRGAAALHATSPREAKHLKRLYPEVPAEMIPHGVRVGGIHDDVYTRAVFERRFPMVAGRRVVLFLSRLAPKKRADLLVGAVARLRERFPDVLLVLAGSDSGCEASLRRMVAAKRLENHVLFTGFLSGPIKQGAFSSAWVFALPSEDENFGLAAVEAMAFGLPCVVGRGVDSAAYLTEAGVGTVVEPRVEQVEAALERYLAASEPTRFSAGPEYVKRRLTWERAARKVERLYERILRTREGER